MSDVSMSNDSADFFTAEKVWEKMLEIDAEKTNTPPRLNLYYWWHFKMIFDKAIAEIEKNSSVKIASEAAFDLLSDIAVKNNIQSPMLEKFSVSDTFGDVHKSARIGSVPTVKDFVKQSLLVADPFAPQLNGGILPDRWIREMAKNHQMITPFEESLKRDGVISYGLSSYGYDARLAPEYKIFTNVDNTLIDPKNFDTKCFVERTGDICIIPPHSFVLARTIEFFRIPRNVLTICLGKSTYARCFTGDTKVALVDGTTASFVELEKRASKGERFWGYSVNEFGNIVVSELLAPRRVGHEKVIELELDNGQVVRPTPDHEFFNRKGELVEAKDLKVGDSLLPLYRAVSRGYEAVFQFNSGVMTSTHWLSDQWNIENGVYTGEKNQHRHHSDHNRRNNRPDNITRVDSGEHIRAHNAENYANLEYRDRLKEAQSRGLRAAMSADTWKETSSARGKLGADALWNGDLHKEKRDGILANLLALAKNMSQEERAARADRMRIRMMDKAAKEEVGRRMRMLWSDPDFRAARTAQASEINRREEITEEALREALSSGGSIRAAARILKCDRSVFRRFSRVILEFKDLWAAARLKSSEVLAALKESGSISGAAGLLGVGRKTIMRYTDAIASYFGSPIADNHKIVAIREVDGTHDVYCLTVPDHGNFALECGVFVKNCGMIVNVTPLEPEWCGHVTLEISNTTPLPAKIYANEGICQFLFLQGSMGCETSYADRKGKYMNQTGVVPPRM